jgi:FkbM family methyltransferase
MNNKHYLERAMDVIHRNLGSSRFAVRLAVLMRNQCRSVIGYHLGRSCDPNTNGEAWFAELVAPRVSVFIDVGANVGNWTGMMLRKVPTFRVALLYEPSDQAVAALNRRFVDDPNIEIIQAAVGDRVANSMKFFGEPNAGEMSSLIRGVSSATATAKNVRVTTLDAEVDHRRLEYVDLIKIDAEGYDLHVLRGASNLVGNRRVGFVQFEYNSSWCNAGSTLTAAFQFLQSARYQVFLLKQDRLVEFDYQRYGDFFAYSNFVAVSPDKLSTVYRYVSNRV